MSTKLIATKKTADSTYVVYRDAIPLTTSVNGITNTYWLLRYSIYRNDLLVHIETCTEVEILNKFNTMIDTELSMDATVSNNTIDLIKCLTKPINYFKGY